MPASLVQEVRNGRVQATHCGHVVHLDAGGGVASARGDPDANLYWRSAAKPLQAVAALRSGAFEARGLGDEALAIACGSHSGQPEHLGLVARMLQTAGLDGRALGCGVHAPYADDPGPQPPGGWTPLWNNCSGKHAAMLLACVERGWPLEGYLEPDHPLQQEILGLIAEATGRGGASEVPHGIDGCGVPTFWLPLRDLAGAWQWLFGLPEGRQALDAMAAHPLLVAGTHRPCTAVAEATGGRVVGKVGAVGVYVLLDRRSGECIAVKTEAGARADTAALQAAEAAGWFSDPQREALADHLRPPVRNHAGRHLGHAEPVG